MEDLPFERSNRAVDSNRFVNPPPFPLSFSSIKQAELVVRVPSGTTNETTEVIADPRDSITGSNEARTIQRLNLLRQLIGHPLIGIERQQPVVSRLANCEVLLLYKRGKTMLEDTRPPVFAELNRTVGTPTIHDDDFIGPGNAVKSRTDELFFVLGDDYGRYLLRGFHGRNILTDARGTVPLVDCPPHRFDD